jgi:hypothetical protein
MKLLSSDARNRTAVLHERKSLLQGKVNAPGIYAEGLVVVLCRSVGTRYRVRNSGIRKQDIPRLCPVRLAGGQ